MFLLRTTGHLLLALAIIVNAGLPSLASATDHAAHVSLNRDSGEALAGHAIADHVLAASDTETCHEGADAASKAPARSSPMDCCDGGICACSCLQHAPVVVLTAAPWELSPYRGFAQLGRLVSVPAAPSAPAIRPPIA